MSFDHLQLFKEIVHQKSISKGAVACGITQSAASQHLQELERRLDTVLLDRSTRPFTLTPAGRLYQGNIKAAGIGNKPDRGYFRGDSEGSLA